MQKQLVTSTHCLSTLPTRVPITRWLSADLNTQVDGSGHLRTNSTSLSLVEVNQAIL